MINIQITQYALSLSGPRRGLKNVQSNHFSTFSFRNNLRFCRRDQQMHIQQHYGVKVVTNISTLIRRHCTTTTCDKFKCNSLSLSIAEQIKFYEPTKWIILKDDNGAPNDKHGDNTLHPHSSVFNQPSARIYTHTHRLECVGPLQEGGEERGGEEGKKSLKGGGWAKDRERETAWVWRGISTNTLAPHY